MATTLPHSLYFHGLPGSAAELAAYGPRTAAKAAHLTVIERADDWTRGSSSDYFGRLAAQIEAQFPEGALHLTGFSLGAAAALRVAPLLGDRVEGIDLISPAGPLDLGNFLGEMAGAPVFRAALSGYAHLTALTVLQALAARVAAGRVAKMLMAGASGEDRTLAIDALFLSSLAASLQQSMLSQRLAYMREIQAYVADWGSELRKVTQPVAIWQGSEDNWTPPAMARALFGALPNSTRLHMLPGLSHFSTLRQFLTEADADVAEAKR